MEKQYVVIRNGQRTHHAPRSLDEVVTLIRKLEARLDRFTQHSPYTVGLA